MKEEEEGEESGVMCHACDDLKKKKKLNWANGGKERGSRAGNKTKQKENGPLRLGPVGGGNTKSCAWHMII